MVDAVLLEWEGVLADTAAARRESLLRALADEGVASDAAAYDECCGGLDVHAAARALLARAGHDDPTLVDLVTLRAGRGFVERLAQGFSLQPGAAEFLSAASARTRVAIVTRAARAETDAVLGLSGLGAAVGPVVTADDVLDAPPAPELHERAIAQLGRLRPVRRERAVALVGAPDPIRGARRARVRVLAVGAPAHVAMEADGAVEGIAGLTLAEIAALVGIAPVERPA